MRILSFVLIVFVGCVPLEPDEDQLPPVDESLCTAGALEADGRDSMALMTLPTGSYVISSTYLRVPLRKSALARFSELNAPIGEALRRNVGVVQVVTRLSGQCNTARTLTVWKDEASMYELVGSPEHAVAVGSVKEVSRGGSIVTHWNDDGSGANWAEAARRVAADDGPTY